MKVLLDNNVPVQLRRLLIGHLVLTAVVMKWSTIENGELILLAEAGGFEVLVTGDQNLSYQQNESRRTIALVVLTQTKRDLVTHHFQKILDAVNRAAPRSFEVVQIPSEGQGIRAID